MYKVFIESHKHFQIRTHYTYIQYTVSPITTMASLLPSSFLSGAWYFVSYFSADNNNDSCISFVIRVVVTLAVYVLWTCCCFYLLLLGAASLTPDGVVFQQGAAYYVVPVVAMLLLLGAIGFLALLRYFWRLPPELNMAAAVPEQDNYYSRLNVNSNTNSPTDDDDARHADPTRTLLGVHYSEEVRIILQKIGRAALILLVWTIFLLLVLIFVNWVVEKIECKKRDVLICGSIPFWCFMASVMLCGAYFICGAVRRHWRVTPVQMLD